MLEQNQKIKAQNPARARQKNSESTAHSLERILNLVRSEGAMTRQEIERRSEMGRAIVTDRLSILSDLNLIDDSSRGATTGGRAPRLIQFNDDAGRFLVATVEQNALGVGIANLSGKLLTEHHEELDPDLPVSNVIGHLSALFDWLLDRNEGHARLWGIGLSVPGPVQSLSDAPYFHRTPPMLPVWDGVQLVEQLLGRYCVPIWMRGSVEAMAMGEAQSSDTNPTETVLFVKIGNRVGASLVSGGTLYSGANGLTGLIGHTPVTTDDGSGSLEAMAGAPTIAELGREAAETGKSPLLAEVWDRHGVITALDVCRCAQNADHAAMDILSRSGRLIGQTVATLANMLNPARIVISGSMVQGNDILLAAVREMVYRNAHPLVTRDLRIDASPLGSSAGLIGAGAVAVDGLFSPAYLKHWIPGGHPSADADFQSLLSQLAEFTAKDHGGEP